MKIVSLAQTWYQASRNSFLNSKECALGTEHWLVVGMIKPSNVWRCIRIYQHLSVCQLPFIVFVSILCHIGTTHWEVLKCYMYCTKCNQCFLKFGWTLIWIHYIVSFQVKDNSLVYFSLLVHNIIHMIVDSSVSGNIQEVR